jgi:hypothetical protein
MDFASQNLTLGQTNALVKIIGGEQVVREILRDEVELVIVRKKIPTEIEVWKTLTLSSSFESTDDLRDVLRTGRRNTDAWTRYMLNKVDFTCDMQVDLVRVSVGELGFKDSAEFEQICAKAKKRGLELCPARVGPELRLQYEDQPENESLGVAMEPISDAEGLSAIFVLSHTDGTLWLGNNEAHPKTRYSIAAVFIFSRPRA